MRRLLVCIVAVGLAASSGGGKGSAQACADFQNGGVDAYEPFNQAVSQVDATVGTLPIAPSDAVKGQVVAVLSAASSAAERAADDIKALGTPPVELTEPVALILTELQAQADAYSLWSDDYGSQGTSQDAMSQVQALLSEASSTYDQAYGMLAANPCSSGASG